METIHAKQREYIRSHRAQRIEDLRAIIEVGVNLSHLLERFPDLRQGDDWDQNQNGYTSVHLKPADCTHFDLYEYYDLEPLGLRWLPYAVINGIKFFPEMEPILVTGYDGHHGDFHPPLDNWPELIRQAGFAHLLATLDDRLAEHSGKVEAARQRPERYRP